MDPDSYQKAWHSQSSQTRVTVAADLLLKEVQRSQRSFRATIFHRDFREVAIGLLMLPLWFFLGHWLYLPWTWYLGVPAITWVILFILVDRIRHKQQPSAPGEPMLDCVKVSLTQVEHQIWLLRNVFWWYLLPCTIAILAFFAQHAWLNHSGFWPITVAFVPFVLFLLVLYGFVYYLNQRAVRRELEPRRQELLTLLASLGDETTGERSPATKLERITNPGILWQTLFVTVLCAVLVVPMFLVARAVAPRIGRTYISNRGTPAAFAHLNTDLRREKRLVGLAAMVTVDGKVVASAVDGERKTGSGEPLDIDDQWHLGGITTSITATMIARLIEKSQLEWSTTIGECFPDAPMHKDWKSVTFQELLTQTSGAPPIFGPDVGHEQTPLGPGLTLARRDAVLRVLAKKSDNPPGGKFAYSNVGPTIAAAMAEKKTGATWEDLVKREVFEPLALTSAGFGPPKSPDDTLPQPRGHRLYLGAKFAASDEIDNSPIMGPAGSVHMSLSDLSTYAAEHLRGHLGKGKLLSAETYKRLHAPRLEQYAYGWGVKDGGAKTPYTIFWHNGTNTLWYAMVVFIPEKNMVVAVTANDGDFEKAEAAAWEIVKDSVKQFSADVDPASRGLLQKADYPKRAPFTGVRWEEDKPVVKIGDEWFKLVSLDGIAAGEIVAFSRQTYADKWQKRFEEDLVELLTRMGHEPKDSVRLVVSPLGSPETRTLENVPMTEANRRAIYDAARARERDEQQPERQGTDGERKNGNGVQLEIGDRWHLGSITKSITAAMIARFHERDQQRGATRSAVSIEDAELFRTRIDEFLNAARTKAGFSGAVIVARGGKPVYEGVFGFSHLESKATSTLDTPFRIASLSKQFTAAAIFRLEAQGKLSIDDPVHKHLPEFAEKPYSKITIHHLLTHTSGLPRIATGLTGALRWNAMSRAATPLDDFVRLAVQMPLEFEPGSDYEYSNFGFRVLAALIARVTGRDYADFMEQEIFQPLGMKDTGVARVTRPPSESRIAEGLTFLKLDGAGQPLFANGEDGRNFGTGYGSGGIYTSANDALRWDRVLVGDEFLSQVQKKRLFQPIHDYYACGWVVKKSGLDGRLYQMHSGSNDGFFSQMMRIPEDDLVIIAVGNVEATPAIDEIRDQLFRLCRSLPYRDP